MMRLLRVLRSRAASESAFSMPEVLVVMLIMGILVGVTVGPGFSGCNSQGARSADQSAKNTARAAAAAMEVYGNDNLGAYDGATGTTLNQINSEVPSTTTVADNTSSGCPTADDTCYKVTTPSSLTPTGIKYTLTKKGDGRLLSSCNSAGDAGCPSNGRWSAE